MKEKKDVKSKESIQAYKNAKRKIPTDVQGSYTGMSIDNEKPVQDADDL